MRPQTLISKLIVSVFIIFMLQGCSNPDSEIDIPVLPEGVSFFPSDFRREITWSPDGQQIAGTMFSTPDGFGEFVFVWDIQEDVFFQVSNLNSGKESYLYKSHNPKWNPKKTN